jgi:hypothetical protein
MFLPCVSSFSINLKEREMGRYHAHFTMARIAEIEMRGDPICVSFTNI